MTFAAEELLRSLVSVTKLIELNCEFIPGILKSIKRFVEEFLFASLVGANVRALFRGVRRALDTKRTVVFRNTVK